MKHKSKLTLLVLTGVSTLVLSAASSYGASGTITAETVRIRENPSTSSTVINTLDENEKVEVLEKSEDWYKISYKGKEGYVYGKYIKVSGEVENAKTEEEPTKEENKDETTQEDVNTATNVDTKDEKVIVETSTEEVLTNKIQKNSKLYVLPLLSSSKVQDVKKDCEVTVLQEINNWIYVAIDEKKGWILKKDLVQAKEIKTEVEQEEKVEEEETDSSTKETKEEEKTTETSAKTTKTGYVNVETAYVREKPTTDSKDLFTLSLNKEVTILSEENNWYKINVGNKEGYIYSKLISSEKVKETTSRSSEDRNNKVNEQKENEVIEESAEKSSASSTDSITGSDVISYAKQYLGCSYVSGGNGPSSFDCSGFTSYVYKHFGYSLNRTSGGQASDGTAVSKDNLKQGDILVFQNDGKTRIGHVGIYIGNGTFIHAANASRGVVTDSIDSSYYASRYVTARRIIE